MKPNATTKPLARNDKIVGPIMRVACQIRLYTLLGVRFALQKEKQKTRTNRFRPVSSFDISSIDDPAFLDCFGLHNLRPLWARDNLKKSAKYEFLL